MKITCPVNSYNEWDPLEEVIVGIVDGAVFPDATPIIRHTFTSIEWKDFHRNVGRFGAPYHQKYIEAAKRDLAIFVNILEAEGIAVRRPSRANYSKSFSTPLWTAKSGFSAANPRDPFLIVGDQIIESPMADRNRYFEVLAYRKLFKEYFKGGAKWISAPKPMLGNEQYVSNFEASKLGEKPRFVITENEPTFDGADFVRCGRDIFGQRSHVTNKLGIEWLRRHLHPTYRVHEIKTMCHQALHIDTTFMPLSPGKVMVNREWLDPKTLPGILKKWEILIAPRAVQGTVKGNGVVSSWINMNVLMLDEKRVVVEEQQKPMIRALRQWGFTVVPCPFASFYPFFGSFHCATLDIRRRGELQDYFL